MAMSNPNPDLSVVKQYIYKGDWTNYDGGQVNGGKITMDKNDTDVLMIFIGIFLVFAEAGLWSLLSFGLFFLQRHLNLQRDSTGARTATPAHRDALWHQKQAVLRNAGDDKTVGITFISLWLTYGRLQLKTVRRTVPIAALAIFCFIAFLVGLPFLVAYAILENQGNEVLIKSPDCGWWSSYAQGFNVVSATDVTNRTREAIQYADTCYEDSAPYELCDDFLVKRNISWTRAQAECPFDRDVCLGDDKFVAFEMESTIIDSHIHLGLNAPKSGRFGLMKTTTCAPLNVSAYSVEVEGSLENEMITEVHFGATASDNYTFAVSNLQFLASHGYNLYSYVSYAAYETETAGAFTPIKKLNRTDADVSVILLNNNLNRVAGTDGPCRDPFFSATSNPDPSGMWYTADSPITAIGCVDQYAFYNPTTKAWSKTVGLFSLGQDITNKTRLKEKQHGARGAIEHALSTIGAIGRTIEIVGTEALKAQRYPGVFNNYQNPLPNDQWKREVAYWFNIQLSALQLAFIRMSIGPQDKKGMTDLMPQSSELAGYDFRSLICGSVRIRDNRFKDFHRAGFIILATLGGLFIILPTLIINGVLCWGRRRNKPFVLDWTAYGHLQLLRMAHEGSQDGGWNDRDQEIPSKPEGVSIGRIETRGAPKAYSRLVAYAPPPSQPPPPPPSNMPLPTGTTIIPPTSPVLGGMNQGLPVQTSIPLQNMPPGHVLPNTPTPPPAVQPQATPP